MLYDALCETLGRPREDHYAAALAPPQECRSVPGTFRRAGWGSAGPGPGSRGPRCSLPGSSGHGEEAPSAIFDALRRAQGGRRDFTLTPYRATGEAGALLAAAAVVASEHD